MAALDVLLNDFAIRSFRDTADRDYIHARLAYRHRLIPQFQWSALHCLEKYAKGILVLNRISARDVKHEVSRALTRLSEAGKFEIAVSPGARNFIARLETGAEFRYFEVSYANQGRDLSRLDLAVSELRRYCQVLDFEYQTFDGRRNLLQPMLNMIKHASEKNERNTCVLGGYLERLMADKRHPARAALIWQNLYFGQRGRKSVTVSSYSEAANSPLSMHPEVLDEVLKYVHIPRRLQTEWQAEIAKGGAGDV